MLFIYIADESKGIHRRLRPSPCTRIVHGEAIGIVYYYNEIMRIKSNVDDVRMCRNKICSNY